MARPREIPHDTDWLRRHLRRYRRELPRGATPAQIADLCAAIPSADWAALKNAWRQREKRAHPYGPEMGHGEMWHKLKRLGPLWERLIAMRLVTEEDALVLAEGGGKWTMYSDSGAVATFSILTSQAADQQRKDNKRKGPSAHEKAVAALRLLAKQKGITDPGDLHTATGFPFEVCLEALAAE
jgi:hypothetical protein